MVTRASIEKELRRNGLTGREAAESVETLVSFLARNLGRGEAVELRGFGSFTVTLVKARRRVIGGKEVVTPAHGKVVFRPGEAVRKAAWKHGAA